MTMSPAFAWPAIVSIVASDSVGRLPDQNVAQAASRLPGVAVESDQGQPRYISIRGAPKNWTTLSFDGINIVSPEGRDARFDSVPSAIAAQIVVSKAVTPDMPGETVAGNVNIHDNTGLKNLSLPALRTVRGTLSITSNWYLRQCLADAIKSALTDD